MLIYTLLPRFLFQQNQTNKPILLYLQPTTEQTNKNPHILT
jgi:hypothetical protein